MADPGQSADVLIVGAGPVGLALAIELVRHGARVRIVDHKDGPVEHSRAIIVHARTLEIFADMGVLSPVLDAGQSIHGASIYAGSQRILHLDFDELDSPYRFALDIPQSSTERILTSHLETLGVEVDRRTTLSGFNQDAQGVTAYLASDREPNETARFQYMVGCDGTHSTVRHTLGLQFAAESTFEDFLLADVRLDWEHPPDEWSIWFHESGTLSVLPIPGGLHRVIADQVAGSGSFDEVLRVWAERSPSPAKPRDPQWVAAIRVHRRNVKEYGNGRVLVAGDAAHVYHPLGGQGMNTGIQEACNLAWKLALSLRGVAAVGLLGSYSEEREPVGQSVVTLTARMSSIATLRHPVSQVVRNRIFRVLAEFEVMEQRVVNRLGETAVNYRRSPWVGQDGRWFGSSVAPGDRAPRIGNILRSPRFKVLAFTGSEPDADLTDRLETLGRYVREGYGEYADFWTIARAPITADVPYIEDLAGEAHLRYAAGGPSVYIVRPDNYIGFRSLGIEPLPVLSYFGRLFDSEPVSATGTA